MKDAKSQFLTNAFAFCIFIFGILASFGGIDLPIITAIIGILTFGYLLKTGDFKLFVNSFRKVFFAYFLIFVLFTWLIIRNILQSGEINLTAKNFIGFLILFPLLPYLIEKIDNSQNKISRAIIAASGFLLFILIYESLSGYNLSKIVTPLHPIKSIEVNLGRAAFIAIIIFWPTLLAMRQLKLEGKFQLALLGACLFISTRFGIDLNFVILLFCGIFAFFAGKFPKTILAAFTSFSALLISFAPWIYANIAYLAKNYFGASLPMSYTRRADMWLYAKDKIDDNLIYGWGLDQARIFNDKVYLNGFEWTAIQMHPHSAPLHIWLEGGLVGALIMVFLLIINAINLFKSPKYNKNNAYAIFGGLSSIMFAWSLSYSIWEQWLWAVVVFLYLLYFSIAEEYVKPKTNSLEEIN
jgi:O-antigen ligase